MNKEQVMSNKQIVFKNYVNGFPNESDMELRTSKINLKLSNDCTGILVKNLYLSCDPYMIRRMIRSHDYFFIELFEPGQPIMGFGVAKVVDSKHPNFKRGDFVWGITGWEEYSLLSPERVFKIEHRDVPLSYYAGLLGMSGVAAYVGLYEIGSPKKGDRLFVTAAAGGVGHIVGQLAKLAGCYVVGSAGSKEKVDLLKDKLGFDEAFNYKDEEDLDASLKRYFPEGIDIYVDNVGGKMLDAVLQNMRVRGRIVASGMISQFKLQQPEGICHLFNTITKRVRIEGFSAIHNFDLYPQYLEMILPLIKQAKISYIEDIAEGFESGPSALLGLFSGRNVGKQIIKVACE